MGQNAKLIIRKSLMWLCLQKCSTTNRFHKHTAPLYCSSGRFLWLPRKCAVIIKYLLLRTQASFRGQMTSETGTVTDFLHEDVRWVCPQECRLTLIITQSGSQVVHQLLWFYIPDWSSRCDFSSHCQITKADFVCELFSLLSDGYLEFFPVDETVGEGEG